MSCEFAVICIQNKPDGTNNISRVAYASETEAWKGYYRSCGNAVDSENLTDAVAILTQEGFELEHKCFVHPAKTNPEPTPEQGE